jgi:hypothetical protein
LSTSVEITLLVTSGVMRIIIDHALGIYWERVFLLLLILGSHVDRR